jgi:hypothetical protein
MKMPKQLGEAPDINIQAHKFGAVRPLPTAFVDLGGAVIFIPVLLGGAVVVLVRHTDFVLCILATTLREVVLFARLCEGFL